MKISRVTAEGFRGFNERRDILLNEDIVLIYGPNGKCKSSLAEALEWVFFGEISRKLLSRCPQEYGGTHIANVNYAGARPYVEIECSVRGTSHTVRKEYVNAREHKLFLDATEVSSLDALALPFGTANKPMLGQVEIRSLVDRERGERWSEIARLLGLEVYADAEEQIRAFVNEQSKARSLLAQENVYNLRLAEVAKVPQFSALKTELELETPDANRLVSELRRQVLGVDDGKALPGDMRALLGKEAQQLLEASALPKSIADLQTPAVIIAIESASFNAACALLEEHGGVSFTPRLAPEEFAFKEAGLKLLRERNELEICPFCGEPTLSGKLSGIEQTVKDDFQFHHLRRALQRAAEEIEGFCAVARAEMGKYVPSREKILLAAESAVADAKFREEGRQLEGLLSGNVKELEGLRATLESEMARLKVLADQARAEKGVFDGGNFAMVKGNVVEHLALFHVRASELYETLANVKEGPRPQPSGTGETGPQPYTARGYR
jgi:DNA repair exonuclease SbcCD ATPase subunit